MKQRIIMLLLSVVAVQGFAQLTLERCHELARRQYPVIKQYELVRQSKNYTVSNASKAYLPQVKVSLGANGFTDPIDFPEQIKAMGMADMKNYLLNGSVQVNQVIYDGGGIAARKQLAKAQAEVDENQLNVRLYDINQRVDQLYFGILMLDEQLKQVKLLQNDLQLSRNTVEAMLKGGVANQSDLDAVAVEQVRAEQQEGSLRASRNSYARMLGLFIGQEVDEKTQLAKPVMPEVLPDSTSHRPELSYFAAQSKLLDTQRKALNSQLNPTISAFAMGMYHNKVMDIMRPGMIAGGITLSWNVAPFYTRKNDLRNLETKKRQIESERETFLFNTRLQNQQSAGVVDDLRKKLEQDTRIITLRERIHDTSVKKVQNGIESVNEMLRDVNAVSEARQQKTIHEIQLLQAIYQLKNINNN